MNEITAIKLPGVGSARLYSCPEMRKGDLRRFELFVVRPKAPTMGGQSEELVKSLTLDLANGPRGFNAFRAGIPPRLLLEALIANFEELASEEERRKEQFPSVENGKLGDLEGVISCLVLARQFMPAVLEDASKEGAKAA